MGRKLRILPPGTPDPYPAAIRVETAEAVKKDEGMTAFLGRVEKRPAKKRKSLFS